MYSLAAKLFWGICAPANLIALLAALGLLAVILNWRRVAIRAIGLSLILLVIFGILPTGQILLKPLENRFPLASPTDIAKARGIIVLGGSENPGLTESRSQPAVGEASARLIASMELAQRFPKKPIIFTGGMPNTRGITQADVANMVFMSFGIEGERAIYEKQAMNTFENAALTYELIKPNAKEQWVLITSAYHMPRAVGSFRKAGWDVIPYTVDYRTRENGLDYDLNVSKRLRQSDLAVHEWVGLLVYRILGKTKQFFPISDTQ